MVTEFLSRQTWWSRNQRNAVIKEIVAAFEQNRDPDLKDVPAWMREELTLKIEQDRIAFNTKDKELFVVKEKYNYLAPLRDVKEASKKKS